MNNRRYVTLSEKELEEAREYLRERLRAQNSMAHNLKTAMEAAARQIVRISYSYNIPPSLFKFSFNKSLQTEVNNVVESLINEIDEDVELLATYGHEDNSDNILAYIFRKTHNSTFHDRLYGYKDKFLIELEIGIAAGLFLRKSEKETAKSIIDNADHPFLNPFIQESIGRIDHNIPNYGRGHSNSMLTAIGALSVFAIAEGWTYGQWLDASFNEAIGFVTFRNSQYPCVICNDYAGWVHPMTDPLPPLHLNCVCGVIYIYPHK